MSSSVGLGLVGIMDTTLGTFLSSVNLKELPGIAACLFDCLYPFLYPLFHFSYSLLVSFLFFFFYSGRAAYRVMKEIVMHNDAKLEQEKPFSLLLLLCGLFHPSPSYGVLGKITF